MYQGRHRRRLSRGNLRMAGLAVSLIGSTLAAPVAPITAQAAIEVDHTWPSWLRGSDIVLNPPGVATGLVEPPAVDVGYAITGDHLAAFDVSATTAGQQEIATFVEQIKAEQGVVASPTDYRVYSLPSIRGIEFADAAKQVAQATALVQQSVAALSSAEPTGVDCDIETNVRLSLCPGQMVRALIATDWLQTIDALVLYLQRTINGIALPEIQPTIDYLNRVIQNIQDFEVIHGEIPTVDTDDTVQTFWTAVNAAVGTVTEFIDNLDLQTELDKLVAVVTAFIDSIEVDGLLVAAGLPTRGEIAEDPTAAPPVGVGDVAARAIEDDFGVGSVLVLPTGTSVALVGAAWNEGIAKVTTVVATSPVTPSLSWAQPDPTAGDKWRAAGGLGCMKRKQNNTAWYDPCSWWYEHTADGNNSRWTWGLVQYGTGKSKSAWLLTSLEVQSWRKTGTPDQDWIKWSPDADQDTGGCTTGTAGVDVKAVKLEVSKTLCEQWDISKGEQPADFANRWRSGWHAINRKERATASVIATDTPNGYVPHDLVSFDYYAR